MVKRFSIQFAMVLALASWWICPGNQASGRGAGGGLSVVESWESPGDIRADDNDIFGADDFEPQPPGHPTAPSPEVGPTGLRQTKIDAPGQGNERLVRGLSGYTWGGYTAAMPGGDHDIVVINMEADGRVTGAIFPAGLYRNSFVSFRKHHGDLGPGIDFPADYGKENGSYIYTLFSEQSNPDPGAVRALDVRGGGTFRIGIVRDTKVFDPPPDSNQMYRLLIQTDGSKWYRSGLLMASNIDVFGTETDQSFAGVSSNELTPQTRIELMSSFNIERVAADLFYERISPAAENHMNQMNLSGAGLEVPLGAGASEQPNFAVVTGMGVLIDLPFTTGTNEVLEELNSIDVVSMALGGVEIPSELNITASLVVNGDEIPLGLNGQGVIEVNEGDEIKVTVTRLGSFRDQVAGVDYATQSVSDLAIAGIDYTSASGNLTFNLADIPNGTMTDFAKDFTFQIFDDDLDEDPERFRIAFDQIGAIPLSATELIFEIVPDPSDPAAIVSLSGTAQTFETDVDTVETYTARMDQASGKPVSVIFTTADDEAAGVQFAALAGLDYIAVDPETLQFPVDPATGATDPSALTQQAEVTIKGDLLDEFNESFRVELSGVSGADLNPTNSALTVMISDNDPRPGFTITDAAPVTESGDGSTVNAVFTVALDAPSGKPIAVIYSTLNEPTLTDGVPNGVATPGKDYEAIRFKSFLYPLDPATGGTGGDLTRQITVVVNDDIFNEPDEETFRVVLSGANNAAINDNVGLGRILDDSDGLVLFESWDVTVNPKIPLDPGPIPGTIWDALPGGAVPLSAVELRDVPGVGGESLRLQRTEFSSAFTNESLAMAGNSLKTSQITPFLATDVMEITLSARIFIGPITGATQSTATASNAILVFGHEGAGDIEGKGADDVALPGVFGSDASLAIEVNNDFFDPTKPRLRVAVNNPQFLPPGQASLVSGTAEDLTVGIGQTWNIPFAMGHEYNVSVTFTDTNPEVNPMIPNGGVAVLVVVTPLDAEPGPVGIILENVYIPDVRFPHREFNQVGLYIGALFGQSEMEIPMKGEDPGPEPEGMNFEGSWIDDIVITFSGSPNRLSARDWVAYE